MRFTKIALTAAFAAGAIQAAAAQTTVDFEELTPNDVQNSPLTSGGLTFVNGGDPSVQDGVEAFFAIEPGSNGTITLAPNYFGSTTTVSSTGAFTLNSFDFSDAFDYADDPIQVDFTFNLLGGGTTTATYYADFDYGMQTQLVGISGITSFSFVTSGSFFGEDTIQTDNWVYTLDTPTGGVPEPATWTMMILGFGAIGGSLRRRNAVRVRYA